MTEERRPGGLTALAVINLIWGALKLLGALSSFATPVLMRELAKTGDEEQKRFSEQVLDFIENNGALWYALIALGLVSAILLLASGIGYLKQKRFLGRVLGNVWALLSIAHTVAEAALVPQIEGGLQLLTLLFVIYPLLTLFLLNTTFKEDFVH